MDLRRLACLLLVASSAAACAGSAPATHDATIHDTGTHDAADGGEGTAGLTLMGLTPSYLVVLNVVGPEQMYHPAEAARVGPTEGELILSGRMAPIEVSSRHTEAHVYARTTGLPVTDVVPSITVTDLDTGRTAHPDATLMQDVVIGDRDVHFGNNVEIVRGHRFRVTVALDGEEVDFHGRLR